MTTYLGLSSGGRRIEMIASSDVFPSACGGKRNPESLEDSCAFITGYLPRSSGQLAQESDNQNPGRMAEGLSQDGPSRPSR